MAPKISAGPTLFRSVRTSRDATLVAFGAAVLTAFALQAAAFLPRFTPAPSAPAFATAPDRAAPAIVASGRAEASDRDAAPKNDLDHHR